MFSDDLILGASLHTQKQSFQYFLEHGLIEELATTFPLSCHVKPMFATRPIRDPFHENALYEKLKSQDTPISTTMQSILENRQQKHQKPKPKPKSILEYYKRLAETKKKKIHFEKTPETTTLKHIQRYNKENKFSLHLQTEKYIIKRPSISPYQALENKESYTAQIWVPAILYLNHVPLGPAHFVHLAEIPMMTEDGHFIVNGSPRTVVGQLVRTPGIYYKVRLGKGNRRRHLVSFLSENGCWLRIWTDRWGKYWARINKSAKLPLYILFRALGVSDSVVFRSISDVEMLYETQYVFIYQYYFANHLTKAIFFLYLILFRTESKAPRLFHGAKFLYRTFFQPSRYSFGKSGRKVMDRKLGRPAQASVTLKPEDVLDGAEKLIQLESGLVWVDNIDHLQNRRVRFVHELIQREFQRGLQDMNRQFARTMTRLQDKPRVKRIAKKKAPAVAKLKNLKARIRLKEHRRQMRITRRKHIVQERKENIARREAYLQSALASSRGMKFLVENQGENIHSSPRELSSSPREVSSDTVRKPSMSGRRMKLAQALRASREAYKPTLAPKRAGNLTLPVKKKEEVQEKKTPKPDILDTLLKEAQESLAEGEKTEQDEEALKKAEKPSKREEEERKAEMELNRIRDARASTFAYAKRTLKKEIRYGTLLEDEKEKEEYLDSLVKPSFGVTRQWSHPSSKYAVRQTPWNLPSDIELLTHENVKQRFVQYCMRTDTIEKSINQFFGLHPLSQLLDQSNPLSSAAHQRRFTSLGPGGVSRDAGLAVRDIHPSHYGRICPIETPEGKNAGLVHALAMYSRFHPEGTLESPFIKQELERIPKEFEKQYETCYFFSARTEFQMTKEKQTFFLPKFPDPGFEEALPRAFSIVPKMTCPNEVRLSLGNPGGDLIAQRRNKLLEGIKSSSDFLRSEQDPHMEYEKYPQTSESNPAELALTTTKIDLSGPLRPLEEKVRKEDLWVDDQTPYLPVTLAQKASDEERLAAYKAMEPIAEYRAIAPNQILSLATSLVPFLEHNDANRALMGSNMQRQAVALLYRERAIVGTGFEKAATLGLVARRSGIVYATDTTELVVRTETGLDVYPLESNARSNNATRMFQESFSNVGEPVLRGTPIGDRESTYGGELSIGRNLLLGYLPWEGYNFEDAVVISDRLVQEEIFTSIHIERYLIPMDLRKMDELVPPRLIGGYLAVGEDALVREDLDEYGIIHQGAFVKKGGLLVNKRRPMPERKKTPGFLLRARVFQAKPPFYDDSSAWLTRGSGGRVLKVQLKFRSLPKQLQGLMPLDRWVDRTVFYKAVDALEGEHNIELSKHVMAIQIFIAAKRQIQVGDKVAGRHGNKGIVSLILPRSNMPYLYDGTPLDMVLNPLGVPSRMNLGQLFESMLGLAGKHLHQGYRVVPFDECHGTTLRHIASGTRRTVHEVSKALVFNKLVQARQTTGYDWLFDPQIPGKMYLFDGRTGEAFLEPVAVGVSYMLKLVHLVDDKIHARSTGPYALVTQQPLRGKARDGGQRIGEMEAWAFEGYGAAYILQELLTIKSDDLDGRKEVFASIVQDNPLKPERYKKRLFEMDWYRMRYETRKRAEGMRLLSNRKGPRLDYKQKTTAQNAPECFQLLFSELQALCLEMNSIQV